MTITILVKLSFLHNSLAKTLQNHFGIIKYVLCLVKV